ncbi:hypothetical protein HPP92_002612 [Vanilla planifolia]|uniref:Uncharacterized protein n=1 Tax=Vanilla planifolia TaxID=51239 RepID=A0A835VMI9_VANPL|nr:hypothetical protein HPP92_002612 [Vanilla planifolia]
MLQKLRFDKFSAALLPHCFLCTTAKAILLRGNISSLARPTTLPTSKDIIVVGRAKAIPAILLRGNISSLARPTTLPTSKDIIVDELSFFNGFLCYNLYLVTSITLLSSSSVGNNCMVKLHCSTTKDPPLLSVMIFPTGFLLFLALLI